MSDVMNMCHAVNGAVCSGPTCQHGPPQLLDASLASEYWRLAARDGSLTVAVTRRRKRGSATAVARHLPPLRVLMTRARRATASRPRMDQTIRSVFIVSQRVHHPQEHTT